MVNEGRQEMDWSEAVIIGETVSFHKTITDADITLYAGLSGDFHRIHLDDEYARQTPFKKRLAHGSMLMGFMSACGTLLVDRFNQRTSLPNVSAGYDRVRFIGPVLVGDTITTTSTVVRKDLEKRRVFTEERCTNQRGELVAIATGIGQFV